MTDPLTDPLVVDFERATLDPARFGHREHLLVAFRYLEALPVEEALARFVRHLRALTIALGAPEKFHATVTWAYVLLMADARDRTPGATFDELLAAHPGLLDHRTGALLTIYDRAQLDEPEARRRFVLPRRS